MRNIDRQNNNKIVICFFSDNTGFNYSEKISAGYHFSEEVFNDLGMNIEKADFGFHQKPHRMTEYKAYDFNRIKKRMFEENNKSNIKSACFDSYAGEKAPSLAYDWVVEVEIGCSDHREPVVFQVGIDCEFFNELLEQEFINSLYKKMIELLNPEYGIIIQMPRNFMPAGYATGLLSQPPKKLLWDANSWRQGVSKEYNSKIRNVHGMNFVNRTHLEQKVGSQTLREWIERDENRGVLEKWNENLFLWTFKNSDSWPDFIRWDNPAIQNVRDELESFDFFPWQKWLAKFEGT